MDDLAIIDMPVSRSVAELRRSVAAWRRADETVALVPTMGALHDGHLSLMRLARARCRRVVATIFVNPTQFAPHEDFDAYPRREAADRAKLAREGVDLLYAPAPREMYPEGFATTVTVSGVSEGLCGHFRPQMFPGVATVVAKLLIQAMPDVAVFGEKDYQQLQVIRRLARDLDLPAEILGGPTVREADGLALSSRNAYLTPEERAAAPTLNRVLRDAARQLEEGAAAGPLLDAGRRSLEAAGFGKVDYLELRAAEGLAPLDTADRPARLLAAAWLGKARLIDNVAVEKSAF
jgi:pantoate--beta-alanine ligase